MPPIKPVSFNQHQIDALKQNRCHSFMQVWLDNQVIAFQQSDHVWVRETWQTYTTRDPVLGGRTHYVYRADSPKRKGRWKPATHMPEEASRFLLRIESVEALQLHDTTEQHAARLGVRPEYYENGPFYRKHFVRWWMDKQKNKSMKFQWAQNPRVLIFNFTRIT